MNKLQAQERIEKLKEVIGSARYAYHVLDSAQMSDSALDSLKHELYGLEQAYPEFITSDSPTQRVGGEPLEKFEKVAHERAMLSMEDVFTQDEFEAWQKRLEKVADQKISRLFCMPKLDGLAVSLVYRHGSLETAATRGNGIVGENVTQNVKTIESIPLTLRPVEGMTLPDRVEVRGEIYIPVKAFEAMNTQLEKEGKPSFANPRNLAAGSIRQLDPKVTAGRGLAFVAWDLDTDLGQRTMEHEWNLLEQLGFRPAPGSQAFERVQDVELHWKQLQEKRTSLGYWIDGMVVRVNDNQLYNQLGVVGKTPRGLVAWKFPAEEATTVVQEITWTVGRTGALTPVAVVEPTWIGGTTVQHASLHNLDEIERLDVRVGDTVILYKAGDIIPKIKQVLLALRPDTSTKTIPPTRCPVCESSVERKDREVAIYCTNPSCFVQDREHILHMVRAFEIDGVGPQTIAVLLEQGLIAVPADLFTLVAGDLLGLEGFAELSANKLVEEIHAHKTISLSKFILALGVRNVGEQTAIDIANHFGSLARVRIATLRELTEVEGIGDVVAQSLLEYFGSARNQELVDAYLAHGVQVLDEQKGATQTPATGKTFVVTGTLSTLGRDEAKERVRQAGGKVAGSVSKKTDFVVAGENPGSKYETAIALGIPVLSEEAFLAMIAK